ncbi:MAG: phosphotriesterase [Puniceicoccaceae bacterium]
MSFIRTVLGDIPPEELGVCYAHEHIIIDDSVATLRFPEFRLSSVDKAVAELTTFYRDGGRAMIDSMPCDAGRNVLKLAEISRRSGVHIVCPTGLHLAKYYDDGHWSGHLPEETIAELFVAEIEEGIDIRDYGCPVVERGGHRAGLIKVASGLDRLSGREAKIFAAAATAHRRTGCPILTHCEQGTAALEQVEAFRGGGVDLSHVVLSHTDRKPDPAYHREILSTGVRVEYDSAFRWKNRDDNPTLDLVIQLLPEFPGQIMLGMDAARPAYWTEYGGAPGLSFLLTDFAAQLKAAGLSEQELDQIFRQTPAETYRFAEI